MLGSLTNLSPEMPNVSLFIRAMAVSPLTPQWSFCQLFLLYQHKIWNVPEQAILCPLFTEQLHSWWLMSALCLDPEMQLHCTELSRNSFLPFGFNRTIIGLLHFLAKVFPWKKKKVFFSLSFPFWASGLHWAKNCKICCGLWCRAQNCLAIIKSSPKSLCFFFLS